MNPTPETFDRANRQRSEYGMRPWMSGAPLVDALGNAIVFREGMMRYTVPEVHGNSHVRILMYDARYLGPFTRFEAHAASETEAHVVASIFAAKRSIKFRVVDKRSGPSGKIITYEEGGRLE